VHLAGGVGEKFAFLLGQGMVPILGDRRNYDVGALGTVIPERFCGGGGRPLRVEEGVVLPAAALFSPDASDEESSLCSEWLEDARLEHASIWSFRRMAAELAAAGSPDELVQAALEAADDEARHTELCLARAGRGAALVQLPARSAAPRWRRPSNEALSCLAQEAWVDGCLGEATAAEQAARAARAAGDREARETQTAIARDERRHAELGWQVLSWCWRAGDQRVRDAIAVLHASGDEARPDGRGGDEDLAAHRGRPRDRARRAAAQQEGERASRRLGRLLGRNLSG
jgi:hypothetical protein